MEKEMEEAKNTVAAQITFTGRQVLSGAVALGGIVAAVTAYILTGITSDIEDVRDWQENMDSEQAAIVRDANASAIGLRADIANLVTAVSVRNQAQENTDQIVASLSDRLDMIASDLADVQTELKRSAAQDTAFQRWAIAASGGQGSNVPKQWVAGQQGVVSAIETLKESPLKQWSDLAETGWK